MSLLYCWTRNNRRTKLRNAPVQRTRLRAERLEDRRVPAGLIAVGTDVGVQAQVRNFADTDINGTYETRAPGGLLQQVDFAPYPNFTGGVRVALGDFDGDGNDELVTAAGPGGGPHVIVFDLNPDGSIGGVTDSFMAYDQGFTGGVFVAAGDIDGDGRAELVTAPDVGGGPHVKIYSDTNFDGKVSDGLVDQFFPFGGFTGGVRLALGNVNNTGGAEVIVAAGPGGGPHVIAYTDGDADRAVSDDPIFDQFLAYDSAFAGGVFVAAGIVENAGSGAAEIITAPGQGGGPVVRIFTDSNNNGLVSDNAIFDEFLAYDAGFTGGVRVAAGDTDDSGTFVEVLSGTGPGGGPHIKLFDDNGDSGSLVSDNPLDDQYFAYQNYSAGVFVAFGKVRAETYSFPGQPQGIPENATLTSSFSVPGGAGIIRDLDISINIFHTFNGDLDVSLVHVSTGTTVVLFTDIGGTDEGLFIRLNDEAGTDIGSADNPTDGAISGQFNPEGTALLSAFDGQDASGEWRLVVTDDTAIGNDTGTLWSWSMHVTY